MLYNANTHLKMQRKASHLLQKLYCYYLHIEYSLIITSSFNRPNTGTQWGDRNNTFIHSFCANTDIIRASFACSLPSIAVIVAQLVTTRFMHRDGTVGIHRPNNILRGGVRYTVTRAQCSYCASNGR